MIHPLRGIAPRIHESVFVAPSADVIGDVEIGAGSSVWFACVLRGDVNRITIGKDTNVQDGTVIHGTYKKWAVTIGDGVSIGHKAMIHGCTIGDRTLVGMGAVILDGAEIGPRCLVGAGALVTQGFKAPEGSLILGAPAKVVRPLKPEEIKSILEDSVTRYKMYVGWYRDDRFPEAQWHRMAPDIDH